MGMMNSYILGVFSNYLAHEMRLLEIFYIMGVMLETALQICVLFKTLNLNRTDTKSNPACV